MHTPEHISLPDPRRAQWELEQTLAARIRSAGAARRDTVAAAAYAEFARQHALAVAGATGRMGAGAGKEAFLRALFRGVDRLLEIGCGYGQTLRALAAGRARALGLDIAAPLAEAAARDGGGGVEFRQGSAVKLNVAPERFGAVFSIDVLEHLHPDDVRAHLDAVRRALRPGGCYVVMTPHATTGPHDISKFFATTASGLHLKEYTYAEVLALATAAGFRDCVSPWLPFRLYARAPWLVRATLVATRRRVPLERALARLPRSRLRTILFQTFALQTVCVVMTAPAGEEACL